MRSTIAAPQSSTATTAGVSVARPTYASGFPVRGVRASASMQGLVWLVAALMLTTLLLPATATSAGAVEVSHLMVLDIAFPTRADATVVDTFDACRSGCSRRHQASDIMGGKHWPLYATVDGTVCRINDDPVEDRYGRNITICGDDGVRYRYLHVNNDTPGTDDGAASLEHVFGPGVQRGSRVARGQLIAFMGDSGNAEATASHLHLDVMVDGVVNPYGEDRINPYPSLAAARARGEYPDGSVTAPVVTDPTDRVGGSDRVGTAIELARRAFDRAATVVLAPSDDPADALTAGPLAGLLDAPVLITPPAKLDDRVLDELGRLRTQHVVVVGSRVGPAVRRELVGAGVEVEVVAGGTRFATAAAVAERLWSLDDGEPREALLALGAHPDADRAWPDALLAGYHGGLSGAPVLLTAPGGLPDATVTALDGVDRVTVVGGDAAVPAGQVEELERGVERVRRLAGSTRYGTGLAVLDDLLRRDLVTPGPTWVTTGRNWPDALAAGPVAASRGELLLVVDGDAGADRELDRWLARHADVIDRLRVVGGPGAVSERALTGVAIGITE